MVLSQDEWPSWVQDTCRSNGWTHPPTHSPMIWRELIDRGGKGVYMGSLEDFMSYAHHYYNIVPETTEAINGQIAAENMDTYNTLRLEETQNNLTDPLRVCITNASSPLAYHLASQIVLDKVFGAEQTLHLQLLDTAESQDTVRGLAMELQDLAHPNLSLVTCTDSVHQAFKAVSAVFVLDEFSMSINEGDNGTVQYEQIFGTPAVIVTTEPAVDVEKNELHQTDSGENATKESTADNGNKDQPQKQESQTETTNQLKTIDEEDAGSKISEDATGELQAVFLNTAKEAVIRDAAMKYDLYGSIMDYTAQKDVHVIVVGNWSNTGAALMARRVTSIDKTNFIASSTLVQSQACSVLAGKLGVASADVQRVGIYGRSQGYNVLVDASTAQVYRYQGSIVGPEQFSLGVKKCMFDHLWLREDYPQAVLDRHTNKGNVYGDRRVCVAEAVGLSKLMKDWWAGNEEAWHSVGVVLGDDAVAVSYPCVYKNGRWERIEKKNGNEELAEVVQQLKEELEKAMTCVAPPERVDSEVPTPTSKL